MKSRWASAENFEKYAQLEAIDYMIRQENDRLQSSSPKSSIDALIDRACGFGVAQDLESIDTITELLRQRIECETFLEIDSSSAKNLLKELAILETNLKSDVETIKNRERLPR